MATSFFAMFPWLLVAVFVGYGMGYRDGKNTRR